MPMPWSATLSSALPSGVLLVLMTTRVRSGLYATAFSSRFRSAVTSRSSSPRTDRPRLPTDASVMPRAFARIRQRSTASATTASMSTGRGSGTGSAAWIRDSVIRSWTRLVSRCASWRILPANRRTASASSAASSIVSASRASAPTGVLSSWLVLATKSRLTSSTRRLSVWSSASTSTTPPPPPPAAPPQGGHPDREARRPAAEPGHRDLELAFPDLAVPAHLAGQRGQLADHQAIALDQPERPRRGARPQHPVVAVQDHGGRGEHGEDRCDARGQPGRLLGRPQPGAASLSCADAWTRRPGSYRHAASATGGIGNGTSGIGT